MQLLNSKQFYEVTEINATQGGSVSLFSFVCISPPPCCYTESQASREFTVALGCH